MTPENNPTGTEGARRLAAVISADIAEYAELTGANDVATTQNGRRSRREVIEPAIREFSGRLVKHTGDGFLAEFASFSDAVRCAMSIQDRQHAFNDGLPAWG